MRGKLVVEMVKKSVSRGCPTVTWDIFEKELLAHFGPMKYKDFDEVLSRIMQWGTRQKY
jgi:hypothetical protein